MVIFGVRWSQFFIHHSHTKHGEDDDKTDDEERPEHSTIGGEKSVVFNRMYIDTTKLRLRVNQKSGARVDRYQNKTIIINSYQY